MATAYGKSTLSDLGPNFTIKNLVDSPQWLLCNLKYFPFFSNPYFDSHDLFISAYVNVLVPSDTYLTGGVGFFFLSPLVQTN